MDLLQKVAVHIVPSVDRGGFSHLEEGVCDSPLPEDGDMEDNFGPEFKGQFSIVEAVKEGLNVSRYVAGLLLDTGGLGVRWAFLLSCFLFSGGTVALVMSYWQH